MRIGLLLLLILFCVIEGWATNIAFVYNATSTTDVSYAGSYKTFLESTGYSVTLVPMTAVAATDFASYDIVIVGGGTGNGLTWGDSLAVVALKQANLPIIGVGEGGYALFGKLAPGIGYPMGAHGSGDSLVVSDASSQFFQTPYAITGTTGTALRLYASNSPCVALGSSTAAGLILPGTLPPPQNMYLPVACQHARYFLWGYGNPPDSMTTTGRELFVNAVEMVRPNLIAWYPLTSTGDDTTASFGSAVLKNTVFDEGGVYCNGTYGGLTPSYVLTDTLQSFNFRSFSISAMFKASPDSVQFRPVFIGGPYYRWIGFLLKSNGKVGFKYNNGYNTWSNASYSYNDWHEATVTYDSTLKVGKLYMDSVLLCTASFSIVTGNNDFVETRDQGVGYAFKGFIKDLKIYNSVITPVATIPLPISPAYGDTGCSYAQTFIWRKVAGAASYEFQIGIDSAFTSMWTSHFTNITDTTFTRSNLLGYTMYFWRVKAANGAWSNVYRFTTGMGYPLIVDLVAPGYKATVDTNVVAFTWYAGKPLVDSYRFILADSLGSLFSHPLIDSTGIPDTTIVMALPAYVPGRSYTWTVLAHNSVGFSSMVWVYTFTTAGATSVGARHVVREFALDQNYPNPFNPTTTIRYCLPVRTHVVLRVYNTLGQKVAELVDGDVVAGWHEVQFDGRTLSSGVYFYQIVAGSFVQTRRLLLLK